MAIERLKVCLNGGRRRDEHPAVPITPAELATAAADAVAAGAEAVHMHPRDSAGAQSLDPDRIAAAVTAVRHSCAGVAVGVSTGLWITDGDPERRPVAAADEILARLDDLGIDGPRLLHGDEAACWPLVAHAGRLGLPTRIGLEDITVGPAGEPVADDADLVREALKVWTARRYATR